MGTQVTLSREWLVTAPCEACGAIVSYRKRITSSVPSGSVNVARDKVFGWGSKIVKHPEEMPVVKCKQCKYIQSWMRVAYIHSIVHIINILAAAICFIGFTYIFPSRYNGSFSLAAEQFGLTEGEGIFAAILVSIFAIGITSKIALLLLRNYNPNLIWYRNTGKTVDNVQVPTIQMMN